jgi:hypothetical protein
VFALTIFVSSVISVLMLVRSTCRMLIANDQISRFERQPSLPAAGTAGQNYVPSSREDS